ncbi:hypothetical protein BST97_04855 [Nonlabens spongiae]|uniref:SCP domain-containing protein n=2 Tax=Nonlabens spongiae TaxID=331648 RepID=A0A1W6MIB8_9FLAO|nr:hypothetical protein BST97_04855 [Nonlabens spongiae]
MKHAFVWITAMLFSCLLSGQISSQWSVGEIEQANTAMNVTYLDPIEKETITTINLARLFPQKFVEYELKNFNGTRKYGDYLRSSSYKKSLMQYLKTVKPLPALQPNAAMASNASCFAIELGQSGRTGHKRTSCEKIAYAECISYGMTTGKEVAMQLLIDHDVPSLGHRKICFNSRYSKIGVGHLSHKKWGQCTVLELI